MAFTGAVKLSLPNMQAGKTVVACYSNKEMKKGGNRGGEREDRGIKIEGERKSGEEQGTEEEIGTDQREHIQISDEGKSR